MATASGADRRSPDWPDDAVEVGVIVDAWGVKGWFKVAAFAAEPQALLSSRRWLLQPPETRPGRPLAVSPVLPSSLKLAQVKRHGEAVVAQAHDIVDRHAAQALKGARVFVSRASFPSAATDEYYWVDLIGMQVVNQQGQLFGTVAGLLDTGAHSVLRVTGDDAPAADPKQDRAAGERLIPFVSAYVLDVSLPRRIITVDWQLDY